MLGMGLSLAAQPAPAWWPPGALYAADFVNDRYMRAGNAISAAEAFGFTRASGKWVQRADGSWVEFGPNLPARTDIGLSLEPAGTNLVPNPGLAGATVGVVGAGGSLPTGWFASGVLTTEVLALTTLAGLPALRLRFFGTPASNFYEFNMIPTGTAIQPSTAYSASIFSQVHAGSAPSVEVRQGTAADSFVVANPLLPGPGSAITRSQVAFNANAATASVRLRLNLALTVGQGFSGEVVVACPQLEAGSTTTSPLISTRDADQATANLPLDGQSASLYRAGMGNSQYSPVSGTWLIPVTQSFPLRQVVTNPT